MRHGLLKRKAGASIAYDKVWSEAYFCAVCGSTIYVRELFSGDKNILKRLKPMDEEVIMATLKELKERLEDEVPRDTMNVSTKLTGGLAQRFKRMVKESEYNMADLVRLAVEDFCEKYEY